MAIDETTPGVVLEQFIAEFEGGFDVDALMSRLGPDPTLEFPYGVEGFPLLVRGRAQCEEFWHYAQRMFREFRVFDLTTHLMVEPGLAMARWRSEAITGGKPRPYHNHYISLARVAGGLIDWYCEYFDPIVDLRAFGRD